MKTGDHILHMDSARGDQIATNGLCFAHCSCRKWRLNGAVPRQEARELHREHFDELLSATFDPCATPAPKRREPSAKAVSRAVEKAKSNRQRKYECPECNQIARGTRHTLLICGLCHEMTGTIVRMVRVDPLPEEIQMDGS